jgi:hypothetical protein
VVVTATFELGVGYWAILKTAPIRNETILPTSQIWAIAFHED